TYPAHTRMFCYEVERLAERVFEAGKVKLVVGHARLTSAVTRDGEHVAYAAIHFGDHNVNGGVSPFQGEAAFEAQVDEFAAAFARVDIPQIIRMMDRTLGESSYSLGSLFRDEQRKVL